MTQYEYTSSNRLKTPHKYMYTEYRGEDFIQSYFKNRKHHLDRFKSQEADEYSSNNDKHLYESSLAFIEKGAVMVANLEAIKKISDFSREDRLITEDIIRSLIAYECSNSQDRVVKEWIDFLVQRFEVTKKLYENYHSHKLRKGDGENENIRLYWLFSLLLTLHYFRTKNIKYLSTLLKVNDLICSLDDLSLRNISKQGLQFLLSQEMENIDTLYKSRNGEVF